jgi:hypothetical protein
MDQDGERVLPPQDATQQPTDDAESERNLVGVFAILLAVEKRLKAQAQNNPPPTC